jgi:hypothetical protein
MDDDQLQYINTFPTVRKKKGQNLHSWRSESARAYREWARSEEGRAQINRLREMRGGGPSYEARKRFGGS